MDKYVFIVDGRLEQTFNHTDDVAEDLNTLKEDGHKVIWAKILYESPKED